MEEKIKEFHGKSIDVNCGNGAVYRGVVEKVDDGILVLKDESDSIVHISVRRVIAFTERMEPAIRPGFIA